MPIGQPGVYWPFKALLEGSGITLQETPATITITATGGTGGGSGDMLKSEYAPSGISGEVDHAKLADTATNCNHCALADSVPWNGVTGAPSSFPSDWSIITNKPNLFPPLPHAPQHLPAGADPIALASASGGGLLAQLSGDSSDYVGGDNAPHPLPAFGGRLNYVSTTQLSFTPYKGAYIKINGVAYPIPSGGISGLTNTNCYIDGKIGNLAANTLYRVYCFLNASTLTAEFSATGHAPSGTAGNIGTEIKSGNDTRSFIGLIYHVGGFVDSITQRYVRSWFNRKSVSVGNNTNGSYTAASWSQVLNVYLLTFADENVNIAVSGNSTNNTMGGLNLYGCYLNGVAVGLVSQIAIPGANYWVSHCAVWNQAAAEGLQNLGGGVYVSSGTMTFNLQVIGEAR